MNQLDRLEALAQRLIEGTFNRLFQTKLHPSDLAHHLAVAIARAQNETVGGQTHLIPNQYYVILNPTDYAALIADAGHKAEASKLGQYLSLLIDEANYQPAGPLEVQLDQSDTVGVGQVKIQCSYSADSTPPPKLATEKQQTTETKETLALASPGPPAHRWLLKLGVRQLKLGEPVVNIGRALDNDIVLSSSAVSRYHVQLRWRNGRYYLCPPPALNGLSNRQNSDKLNGSQPIPKTAVNRRPVAQHPLAPGDVITLGDTTLTVDVEPGDLL